MIFLVSERFSYEKTLIIAFIGAVIGKIIIIFVSWIKRKIDLARKRKMIVSDLKGQNEILDSLKEKHLEQKDEFQKKDTDTFTTSLFHTLQLDIYIYNSVAKNELYSIFKKQLADVVNIYKSPNFLREFGPQLIYTDCLKKSDHHLEEKKNDPNHEFYCETHLSIIKIAVKNIDNNLDTIDKIKTEINKI